MRLGMILSVTAFAVSTAFVASPASAQNGGRAMNDGGFAPSQSGVAQYNSTGQVVGTGPGSNEASGSCAQRFHSFDPATGTYLGRDGRRHPC
jgi:BA14K-like protein